MRGASMIYALFCTLVVIAFAMATIDSYSPFAEGGRSAFFRGSSGPHHK